MTRLLGILILCVAPTIQAQETAVPENTADGTIVMKFTERVERGPGVVVEIRGDDLALFRDQLALDTRVRSCTDQEKDSCTSGCLLRKKPGDGAVLAREQTECEIRRDETTGEVYKHCQCLWIGGRLKGMVP